MSAQNNSAVTEQMQVGSFLPAHGGYYAGLVNVKGVTKAIIVAPKALGEHTGQWSDSNGFTQGATCPFDGYKNTLDMIVAGSPLGKWVQSLNIGGHTDWHIPSRDQLEIIYRGYKPTESKNAVFWGKNIYSCPPHERYEKSNPSQCHIEQFREGGAEAFDATFYWSSTEVFDEDKNSSAHDLGKSCVFMQNFSDGAQDCDHKINSHRARAVRTINVSDLFV